MSTNVSYGYRKKNYKKPYKKFYRKSIKQGTYSNSLRKGKYQMVKRLPTISPDSIVVCMKYSDYFNFASGGAAAHVTTPFRMNGAYDPVVAVGGGTCSGWNEWSAIYGRYRVLASKIKVWGYNTCATPLIFSIFSRNSTDTALASAVEIQQKSMEYGKDVRATRVIPHTGNGMAHPEFRLKMYKTIKGVEGSKDYDDEAYTAAMSTTPVNQTYWDVNVVAMDGVAVSITCNALVQIYYYVKLYQRNIGYTD